MRALVTAAMLLIYSAAYSQEVAKPLRDPKVTLVSASGATKTGVAIVTRMVKTSDVVLRAEPGQFPAQVRVVNDLSIEVNGKPIFVPRTAFADLLNVESAQLTAREGGGTLTLRGGDGAESYLVTVAFDSKRVRSRKVFSSLAPGKPVEESRYSAIVVK
jgi:hypothetical protein